MEKSRTTEAPGEFSAEQIFRDWDKGKSFSRAIDLENTVEVNENFFIGKQWEGVQSNGLPTPVFNFLKRVVLFQVASILSERIKMVASPLSMATEQKRLTQMAEVVTGEFEALFEFNRIGNLLREYLRNTAVDGDGCLYTYWDPEVETGQPAKGAIRTELIENTRVFFGNPNDRRVQKQPYILIERREQLAAVKRRARENGAEGLDRLSPDTDAGSSRAQALTDGRVTVLLKFWREDESGDIWACEAARGTIIRKPWRLGIRLYPLTWLSWDYVHDCYHGQAMLTGLVPNQVFVNRTFAMVQLSLMQSAFPKTVYDKTRVSKWTNQVGAAIGINGGDMSQVAKILEPAQISPQIAQFIQTTIDYTQTFLGATSAALGDTRPDNTSAIIALQRASSVPSEIVRQNLYQSVEELGQIYLEFMLANYGQRMVRSPKPDLTGLGLAPPVDSPQAIPFDFSDLRDYPMMLKLDVGASSYWSEIASMQTLDNLLQHGHITAVQYLRRMPAGYIQDKEGLIEELTRAQTDATAVQKEEL